MLVRAFPRYTAQYYKEPNIKQADNDPPNPRRRL